MTIFDVEHAEQDQELADEVRRARHREVGQRDDQEQRGEHRGAERDAAHVADVLRPAGARGQEREDEERRRDHEAVVEGLQERALGARVAQGEDPQRDEAQLGDRRVAQDQPGIAAW